MDKTYLGNVQVAWTNGEFPSPPPREEKSNVEMLQNIANTEAKEDDLPF